MEKTVKHFCTTANRIQKGSSEFIKSIDWKKAAQIGGTSFLIAGELNFLKLKEKLQNISIRYTGSIPNKEQVIAQVEAVLNEWYKSEKKDEL